MIKNIFFNFLGLIWSIASNFLFLPFYIKILGFDSYSIITYPLILVGMASILETVFTSTLSRELSRKDTTFDFKIKTFDSIENLYCYLIIIVFFILFLTLPYLVNIFIKSSKYSSSEIATYFKYFLFDFSFSLLIRFYLGALLGLKKQVLANNLVIFWGFMKNGLVIGIVYFFPSLFYFYSWQAVISFFFFLIFRLLLNKELFGNFKISKLSLNLDFQIIKPVLKFSLGMFFISLVSIISTLLDRVYISKFFESSVLGNYTLAISLCTVVYIMTKPVSVALLPVFTGLVTSGDNIELVRLFNIVSKAVVAITFPVALSIFFYAQDILLFWLHDVSLAKSSAPFLKILVIGYAISSLQHLYYDVVIANGNTKINNYIGIGTLALVFPSYYYGAYFLGPIGIPLSFTTIQIAATLVFIYYVNLKYINKNGGTSTFIGTYLIPFLVNLMFIYFLHYIVLSLNFSNFYLIIAFLCSIIFSFVLNIYLMNIYRSIIPLLFLIKSKFKIV